MADSDSGGTPVTLLIQRETTPVTQPPHNPPVTHPRPHLPFTGFDLTLALVLAALSLALGAVLLLTARPRSRRT